VRIRTRYKLFRAIIVVAIIVFLVSLYDMFGRDAEWQRYILLAYLVLAVLALILYIGHKPVLTEEPIVSEELVATPEGGEPQVPLPVPEEEAVVEVSEVAKPRAYAAGPVQGPHAFRCPYCSQVFGLEATHLRRSNDFRMDCPYCANNIRIPRAPKVAPGDLKRVKRAKHADRVLFTCGSCGEVLRFTAPQSRLERALSVRSCPNCRSPSVVLAAA
jgi:uncharacterized Zn-finger protein